ncbi:MAG TPA: VWA domain-containing protein [Pyrinomonadaceae bacterium]
MRRRLSSFIAALLLFIAASSASAQQPTRPANPEPSPAPSTVPREEQEPVRVFTEEVRLPVLVTDDEGRFDPTLELEDVMVFEDDAMQEVTSLRHVPANVLLLLDTGNQMALAKSTNTTREIALRLVSSLRPGDRLAVVQFNERVETLQDWTNDKETVARILKTKLIAGKRTRLAEALAAASSKLLEMPAGSRHLVLITDGVEGPGGKLSYEEAARRLTAAQATLYVISYTELTRQIVDKRFGSIFLKPNPNNPPRDMSPGANPDPTMSQVMNRNPSYKLGRISTDFKMRQQARDYAKATVQSERRLAALADETGGRLLLAKSTEEIIRQGAEVAREMGAEYVLTYRPRRALASAQTGEYRRLKVALRRGGLSVRARRGYVVTTEERKQK